MGTLYDSDIVAWAAQQAALLRARKFDELDLDNIVEEIEDVARSEQREFSRRLSLLTSHLLKWRSQPSRQCGNYLGIVQSQRRVIKRFLRRTPSLRNLLHDPEFLMDAWLDALVIAYNGAVAAELPASPIWSALQILDPFFFPIKGSAAKGCSEI